MKKLLALVMLAAPLYLAGCDKENGDYPDADATGDPDVTPDPTTDPTPDPTADPTPDPTDDPDDDTCTGILGGICNVVEQCGCMPAFACVFAQDSATCTILEDCQSGTGTLGPGEECTGNECAPGSSCLCRGEDCNCHQWCFDSSDCSEAGRECTVSVNFTLIDPCSGTGSVDPYMACDIGCPDDAACDLFEVDSTGTTNGCPDGDMCMKDNPIASGGCDITLCIEEGTGAEGDECSDSESGCTSSMGCYGNDTSGYFCRKYCDDSHTCTTGTCSVLGSEGDTDLGICTP
jgi:hypothetical protein